MRRHRDPGAPPRPATWTVAEKEGNAHGWHYAPPPDGPAAERAVLARDYRALLALEAQERRDELRPHLPDVRLRIEVAYLPARDGRPPVRVVPDENALDTLAALLRNSELTTPEERLNTAALIVNLTGRKTGHR